MTVASTDRDLADALMILDSVLEGLRSSVSRAAGLTPQQGQLLCELEHGDQSHGQLADRLHCDKTNITGLVDRLQRRGLVERQAGASDRRVSQVVLTQAGRELVVQFRAGAASVVAGAFSDWSQGRKDNLRRLCLAAVSEFERASSR